VVCSRAVDHTGRRDDANYVTNCQALMLKTRVAGQCALYSRRSFALMLVLGSDYWDRTTVENVELGLINIIIVSIIVMSSYTEYSKPVTRAARSISYASEAENSAIQQKDRRTAALNGMLLSGVLDCWLKKTTVSLLSAASSYRQIEFNCKSLICTH